MPFLNEDLAIDSIPPDHRAAFIGGRATRRLVPVGTKLYKFTAGPLVGPVGRVSPWWSSVDPLEAGDPGLAGTLERARRLAARPDDYARARAAVTRQWNALDGLLEVLLLESVYGFAGRCSAQRVDATAAPNVVYIGGAYQLYIPNLTARQVMPIARTPAAQVV